jgi:hypothetical protein
VNVAIAAPKASNPWLDPDPPGGPRPAAAEIVREDPPPDRRTKTKKGQGLMGLIARRLKLLERPENQGAWFLIYSEPADNRRSTLASYAAYFKKRTPGVTTRCPCAKGEPRRLYARYDPPRAIEPETPTPEAT